MSMQRQLFDFTDTGTQTLTSGAVSGRVEQYRWVNVAGDTGGTLELGIYPKSGDTGDGWLILNRGLEPQARGAFPLTDTGMATYTSGDRLIAKKTGVAGTGRLYVWVKN